ncbi:hypothetical protein DPMN_122637 [Dreissena polymorpha]|uniref:Uncharacterized protein n=1 Tax=Dreissena polymorpha TaxID=45954 RepID=A0A9D4GS95_DREPO|nr:hypothetical protein DPMN_122637 [Dreissena polymorpha]
MTQLIVYLIILGQTDANRLQEDLQRLEGWERDWAMEFNPNKCEMLRITRKKNPSSSNIHYMIKP